MKNGQTIEIQSIFALIQFFHFYLSSSIPLYQILKQKMLKNEIFSLPDYNAPTFPFEEIKSGKFLNLPKLKTREKRLNSWSLQESYLYLSYLKVFHRFFENHEMTKYLKIYRRMTTLIVSRTSSQIKSHHQKIMKRYGSIESAIESIEFSLIFLLSTSKALFNSVRESEQSFNDFLLTERQKVANLFQSSKSRIIRQNMGRLCSQSQQKTLSAMPVRDVKVEEEIVYVYYQCSEVGKECKVEKQ